MTVMETTVLEVMRWLYKDGFHCHLLDWVSFNRIKVSNKTTLQES